MRRIFKKEDFTDILCIGPLREVPERFTERANQIFDRWYQKESRGKCLLCKRDFSIPRKDPHDIAKN